jgi:CheY-like chemotaxis protein
VNEVVILTPEMSEQIAMNAPAASLARSAAASGMRNLRDVGVDLAKSGKTTLQELERVLGNAGIQRNTVTHESAIFEAADAPRRVLVVDDDPIIRHLAVAALTDGGFAAESVDDGARALERLGAGERWDLVVTDLDMPIVTGGELLRSIRNSNATAELPVIVLTGSSSTQNSEVELIEAGANDYLRKPLDPPRFIARIRAALRSANGDQFTRVTVQ